MHLQILAALAVSATLAAQAPHSGLADAVAARPRDPRLHNEYGIELQNAGRAAEAAAHFRTALDLDPRYVDAANNLALSLLSDDRAAGALSVLDKHPMPGADHQALRGAVLGALGRPAEAAAALRRAVALAPGNPDYLYDLAIVLLRLDATAEVASLIDRGRQKFPRSAKIHAVKGMVAYLTGKNAEAMQAYETAVKLEPNAADFHASLGDVYSAADKLQEASRAYERALQLDPSSAAYYVKAGRNLLKLQRTEEAGRAFGKALAGDPANPEANFQLGKLAVARGDHAGAVPPFERAVEAAPSLKEAWYQLSLSYRSLGQPEKSREALERFKALQ
ncbi:MAG: tetratricopeptide repeat protein [Bryobacteraceae bacterium]